MTIEQYLRAMLGEIQFNLAAALSERDALKARVAELEKQQCSAPPTS